MFYDHKRNFSKSNLCAQPFAVNTLQCAKFPYATIPQVPGSPTYMHHFQSFTYSQPLHPRLIWTKNAQPLIILLEYDLPFRETSMLCMFSCFINQCDMIQSSTTWLDPNNCCAVSSSVHSVTEVLTKVSYTTNTYVELNDIDLDKLKREL